MIKSNQKAFTLAEVLVTLMIIGIIAAMTIPGLRKGAEQKELATGCMKAYSTLAQAISKAETENGPIKRWGLTEADTDTAFDILTAQLNVSKKCKGTTGCMGEGEFYKLDGTAYPDLTDMGFGTPARSFVLADGMSIAFDIQPTDPHYTFFVDVNGAEAKPNTLGYDVFEFFLYPDERAFYPAGKGVGIPSKPWGNCEEGGTGLDCAARVLQEGGIKY